VVIRKIKKNLFSGARRKNNCSACDSVK